MTWPEFVALVETEIKASVLDPDVVHIDYMDFSWCGKSIDVYLISKRGEWSHD